MTQNLTIGFIGYGNMAQAIAQGFVDAGVVTGGQMVACAAHYDKLEKTTAELGVRPLHNALEVVTAADVVIIAIKPYQIAAVVKPLADELAKPGKIVVSIAAGWNLKKYQDLFATEDGESVDSSDIHIQCTIPNTPMAVGKGVLVTESVNTLTDDETETFEQLFGPISLIERVDTAHMNIAMVVAGCAPAFTDMYIEALGDAGVQYGLQRATAYRRRQDGRRCRRALHGHRNPSRGHEGRRVLARRHHHQGRRPARKGRFPRLGHRRRRCHRRLTANQSSRIFAYHSQSLRAVCSEAFAYGRFTTCRFKVSSFSLDLESCLLLSESSDCPTSASPPCSTH